MTIYIEDNLPNIRENGLNTQENARFEGTVTFTGATTLTGAQTITAATVPLTLTNTDAGASSQGLIVQGDSASPASNDEIYQSFQLSNAAGTQIEFGRISTRGNTITAGAEVGSLRFGVMVSGTLSERMALSGAALALSPISNDGLALGTSSLMWSDLFLATGGVINFNNGNVTITHSAGNLAITGVTTVASATATPAGGSTSATLLFGTTAGFGIYYGSGVPTVSAAQGSLYLRSDGSSTSTRLYVNTNGTTGWTNFTSAT